LRQYAAMKPEYQVLLQSQIFGLANTLKYQKDVLAALKGTNVLAERQRRERELTAFLETRPELKAEFGGVLAAQARSTPTTSRRTRISMLRSAGCRVRTWLATASASTSSRSSARRRRIAIASRSSRNGVGPMSSRGSSTTIRPIAALDEEVLATGFEKALALPAAQQIPAVKKLGERIGPSATPRAMAHAVVGGSKVASLDVRKELIEAKPDRFESSSDPAIGFARDLLPSLNQLRQRTRILNEKLLRNRSAFARALTARAAMTRTAMYPDANFTLRATYGHIAGYSSHGKRVPFTTRFADLFTLAKSRGNNGDYRAAEAAADVRTSVGDAVFRRTMRRCRSTSSAPMTSPAATRAARSSTARWRSSG